jgi:2-(3-amino-3-carboxypropyl)histidine synthase
MHVQTAKAALADKGFSQITIPQDRPLSAGEILGCTAPSVSADVDAILFVADGRFHLEALMIANPALPAFR